MHAFGVGDRHCDLPNRVCRDELCTSHIDRLLDIEADLQDGRVQLAQAKVSQLIQVYVALKHVKKAIEQEPWN
jgi:hypothetical protein